MTNYRLTPLQNISEHKRRIIERARKNMQTPLSMKQRKQMRMPAVIAALTVLLALFLAVPFVQQAFFGKVNFTIEKVVIPNVSYDSLINSTYIEETNEIVYSTDTGFYAFDVEKKQASLLVNTSEVGQIYNYAVSENWLIWGQPVENVTKMHVYNRQTHEISVLEIDHFYRNELKNDTIIYLSLLEQNVSPIYMAINLKTGHSQTLREFKGGSNSGPTIDGNYIAISEQIDKAKPSITTVSVHDFETAQNIGSYSFPYEIAQNVLLKGNKIFGLLWNSGEMKPPVVGMIDMATNEFKELDISFGVDGYATNGQHFAISVAKGESNTVQLFELEGTELKRVSTLPQIKERLVKPRFTEQGTLVVNGEGPDKAMYLIKYE